MPTSYLISVKDIREAFVADIRGSATFASGIGRTVINEFISKF